MPDLNSVMLYKVKTSIRPTDTKDDLLWKIVMHIRAWQMRKCKRRGTTLPDDFKFWSSLKYGGKISSADGSVHLMAEFFSADEGQKQYWACRIVENIPLQGEQVRFANRRWLTEIGYEQDVSTCATFSCVVSYCDRAGFIGPYLNPPDPSVPNLVRNITADSSISVFSGPDAVSETPCELSPGMWPNFFQRIMDPARQLPYILVSPQVVNQEAGDIRFLVDYQELSKKLFGNALVFYYCSPDFEQEMTYLNDAYTCFGGAIRVYQPGVQEAYHHRYLSANDITEYGSKSISLFLIRAFAQNVNFYDSFFCVEECKRKREEFTRQARLAQLEETHKEQLSKAELDALDLATEQEEKRLRAEVKASALEGELDEARTKIYALEAQVELLRSAADENSSLRRALDARHNIQTMPKTVEEVVSYYSHTFSDRLVFSADAIKSLKGYTLEPDVLWDDLFALANAMCDLYRSGSGDIYKAFREQTGKTAKRGEGAETRKDKSLMRQYTTSYNGETIDIEAHITYAKQGQSIHFGFSPTLRKVVIGHCGEHLDNYSTKKVK